MWNVVTPKGREEIERAWTGEFWLLLEAVVREFNRHDFHLWIHTAKTEVAREMQDLVHDSHDNTPVEIFLPAFESQILNHPLVVTENSLAISV